MGFTYNPSGSSNYPIKTTYTIQFSSSNNWVNERYTSKISPTKGNAVIQVIKPMNGSAGDMFVRLYGEDGQTGDKTLVGIWTIENITGAPTYRTIYLGDLTRFSSFYIGASFQSNGGSDATVNITLCEAEK